LCSKISPLDGNPLKTSFLSKAGSIAHNAMMYISADNSRPNLKNWFRKELFVKNETEANHACKAIYLAFLILSSFQNFPPFI
jgi:hypothetical protein